MSLFGNNNTQNTSAGSLFGANTSNQQAKPSLFGSSSQPQQSNSLFGNSTNTTQAQSGGGLFGNANTSSTGGGLFGSNTQTSGGGGGLFGSMNNNQQSGGSLFGNANNQQSNSGQSGGLFGSTNQQSSGGGLFGNSSNQQSGGGGGLFGSTTNNQPAGGNSLFGNTTNQNQQNNTSSLFNNTQNQQQPQNPKSTLSLFGTNQQPAQQQQQQAPNSLFNQSTTTKPFPTLSLGQSTTSTAPQQTVPGVRIDTSQIRGTTRFTDLHEDLQTQITQIDDFITRQISYKDQCAALLPSHAAHVASLAPDVAFVTARAEGVEGGIDNDGRVVRDLKALVKRDQEDLDRVAWAIENLKLPERWQSGGGYLAYSYGGMGSSSAAAALRGVGADASSTPNGSNSDNHDLIPYFSTTASEMLSTLQTFENTISEIERHLGTVEASAIAEGQAVMMRRGRRSEEDTVRELAGVLREFEGGIVGVAGRVGGLREGVSEVVNGGVRGRY